jgi:radical SAM-linked protein
VAQVICRYRKGDQVRWISHLDLKRTLERAMRRARLPLALSQGHNPHPKLSFGPPLPLGATGDAEVLAIHLAEAMGPGEVKDRLNEQLPPGLEIAEAWMLPRYKKKETFGDIDIAQYQVLVRAGASLEELHRRIEDLLASEELIVHRGGQRPTRTVDLRPFILSLAAAEAKGGGVELGMRLRTGSHGGARPQEVIALLGLEDGDDGIAYHRTALYAGATPQAPSRKGPLRRWTRARRTEERREGQ